MPRGRARVGCSGWSYADWRGVVYPADAPARTWFATYAEWFDTVELNATFYRLPTATTVEGWAAQAPPDFCYAVKVGQFGTHRHDVYAYFNNDWDANAVADARWLRDRIAPGWTG